MGQCLDVSPAPDPVAGQLVHLNIVRLYKPDYVPECFSQWALQGCGTTSETSRQGRLALNGGDEAWQPSTMRR